MRGLLVLGTDTGVGKTMVAAGLVRWRRDRGLPVDPFKPVETGFEGPWGDDAALLAQAAGLPPAAAAGVVLPEPLAPEVAADRAGWPLGPEAWDARVAAMAFPIIEPAGGALVRLAPGLPAADLARRWSLTPLLVAANRLGVLNHACLTCEALAARGAPIRVVALTPVGDGLAERTNAAELARLLPVARVVVVPHVPADRRRDPAALADAVDPLARVLWTESP